MDTPHGTRVPRVNHTRKMRVPLPPLLGRGILQRF